MFRRYSRQISETWANQRPIVSWCNKKSEHFNVCHVKDKDKRWFRDDLSTGYAQNIKIKPVKSTENKSLFLKLRFIAKNDTETYTIWLFETSNLVLSWAQKNNKCWRQCYKTLKRVWLVSIATILSETFTIHFLFMSAIAHNWSFFTIFKQTSF